MAYIRQWELGARIQVNSHSGILLVLALSRQRVSCAGLQLMISPFALLRKHRFHTAPPHHHHGCTPLAHPTGINVNIKTSYVHRLAQLSLASGNFGPRLLLVLVWFWRYHSEVWSWSSYIEGFGMWTLSIYFSFLVFAARQLYTYILYYHVNSDFVRQISLRLEGAAHV